MIFLLENNRLSTCHILLPFEALQITTSFGKNHHKFFD